MYTFVTILVLSTSLACSNSEENITSTDNSNLTQSVTKSDRVIETPTFEIYGELASDNYLNGGEDSITLPYGFLVERVAGCEVTDELVESVKENNRVANEQMIASFGEMWLANFEKKSGMNLTFPQF